MQITMQAFGWRLMIDRVERPRREARPRRGHAAPCAETRAARLRRDELLKGSYNYQREFFLHGGGMF